MKQANYTNTISRVPVAPPTAPEIAKAIADVIRAVVGTLCHWQSRHLMRQKMAILDDRLLDDIGLSREQIMTEAEKPFWKD